MRTAWWENGSVVVELREEELKNIEEQVELKWEASIKESRKRQNKKDGETSWGRAEPSLRNSCS